MFVGIGMGVSAGGVPGPAAPPAKTYDDFVAHITALATQGSVAWGTNMPTTSGGYRTTAATAAGEMAGSTWQNVFKGSVAAPCRMIQHGLSDQETFNAQIAAGREVFFRTSTGTNPAIYAGVLRNGYESIESSNFFATRKMDEIIYWDGTQAQRMQPYLGLGPEPYTWP